MRLRGSSSARRRNFITQTRARAALVNNYAPAARLSAALDTLPRCHVFGTSHLVPRLLTANLSSRYAQTLTGGADSITVKWSDFTEPADTIAIKLCFHKDKTVDRPWRKFKDNINKNKQCWQTAKLAKFLKEGIVYDSSGSGSELIELPMNTAPSTYSVQVLSQAGGTYKQWGDSNSYTQTDDKCAHVTVACPTCAWPPPPAPPPTPPAPPPPPPPLTDADHAAGLAGLLVLLATTTINMLLTL